MRVDRDAAAVVADRQAVAGVELDLDPRRMAGDRLVHRIVDHFGGEVVQSAGVGPADIHAGPAAHRLEALEDLDRGSIVIVGRPCGTGSEEIGHYRNAIGAGGVRCQAAAAPQLQGMSRKHPRQAGSALAPAEKLNLVYITFTPVG